VRPTFGKSGLHIWFIVFPPYNHRLAPLQSSFFQLQPQKQDLSLL